MTSDRSRWARWKHISVGRDRLRQRNAQFTERSVGNQTITCSPEDCPPTAQLRPLPLGGWREGDNATQSVPRGCLLAYVSTDQLLQNTDRIYSRNAGWRKTSSVSAQQVGAIQWLVLSIGK